MTTQTLLAFDEAAVAPRTSAAPRTLEERIAQSAWEAFETQLTRDGYAVRCGQTRKWLTSICN